MIRAPIVIFLGLFIALAACGAQQPATTLPELDPRRTQIQDLEEQIHVATEQMSAGGALCADVCRLADDICKNQGDICRLAGESPGDAWGHERCDKATASCQDAKARCLACRQP